MNSSRPVHYLPSLNDPARVAALLVPHHDRAELVECDLDDHMVIDLDDAEGNMPVLIELVRRGFLRLGDLLAAAEGVAVGVRVRDLAPEQQDVLHLLHNLGQARHAAERFDA